jgi:hypothetical protein
MAVSVGNRRSTTKEAESWSKEQVVPFILFWEKLAC